MEKSKNLIIIQAFMLLCAFMLPFISVYCQESRKPTVVKRQRPVRRIAVPTRRVAAPIPVEELENPELSPDELPNENKKEIPAIENTEEETENNTTTDTKHVQAATQAPSAWANMYKTFAIVLLNSLYKGSETGIGALTKIVIKRFIERRDVLAVKEGIEAEKETLKLAKKLLTEEGRQKFAHTLQNLPEIQHEEYIKEQLTLIDNIPEQEKDILKKEVLLKKLEQETSLTAIAATGVYMGILNTAVPMMGVIMGTVVKIGLQMLMPTEQ